MTLYIALILIYHFQMEWWWYVAAILAYFGHVYFQIYLANREPRVIELIEQKFRELEAKGLLPKGKG